MKLNLIRFWPFRRKRVPRSRRKFYLPFPERLREKPRLSCLDHRFGQRWPTYWAELPKCVTCGRPWRASPELYFTMCEDIYDKRVQKGKTDRNDRGDVGAGTTAEVHTEEIQTAGEDEASGGEQPGRVQSRPKPPSQEIGSDLRMPTWPASDDSDDL